MNTDFPRLLTLLRKERGQSQKDAAAALGISQALLSHYEKGIRECGLDFLCRAADYYGVTADYLLGRTTTRTREAEAPLAEPAEDKRLHGSVMARLGKLLSLNAISVLFDGMQEQENREYAAEAQRYLSLCIYKLYRYLYIAEKQNPTDLFSLKPETFPESVTAAMLLSEMRLRTVARDGSHLSCPELAARFPQQASALVKVLRNAEEAVGQDIAPLDR